MLKENVLKSNPEETQPEKKNYFYEKYYLL